MVRFARVGRMDHVDLLIVGQGIAGTVLAWESLRRGLRVRIVDDAQTSSASKVAAGLVTPISGQRLTVLPHFDEFWKEAVATYRFIEHETGTQLWNEQSALRVWRSEKEFSKYHPALSARLQTYVHKIFPPSSFPSIYDPWGSFEMAPAARLNMQELLVRSRARWLDDGYLQQDAVDPNELCVRSTHVEVPRLQVRAAHAVFCTGIWHRGYPGALGAVRLRPNQGDILSIRTSKGPAQTVHCGIWVSPDGPDAYLLGATYRWEPEFSNSPRAVDREFLMEAVGKLIAEPVEVLEHRSAFRPASLDQRPIMGCFDEERRIGVLNGLGSRGTLQAPRCAKLLLDLLLHATPVPASFRWDRGLHQR